MLIYQKLSINCFLHSIVRRLIEISNPDMMCTHKQTAASHSHKHLEMFNIDSQLLLISSLRRLLAIPPTTHSFRVHSLMTSVCFYKPHNYIFIPLTIHSLTSKDLWECISAEIAESFVEAMFQLHSNFLSIQRFECSTCSVA